MSKISDNMSTQTETKKFELKKQKKTQQELNMEMFLEYLKQRKEVFSKKKVEVVQINSQTINSNPIKANMNSKFEMLLDKL